MKKFLKIGLLIVGLIIVFVILQFFAMFIPFRLGVVCGGYGAGFAFKKECSCIGLKTEQGVTPGGNSYSCLGQCGNCHCYEDCRVYSGFSAENCSQSNPWVEVNCTG
jgi:hypothetical protein